MSEQDEARPLTRRERRLREMAETGQLPQQAEAAPAGQSGTIPAEQESSQPESEPEVFISPVDENGRLRTRREIRELRRAALAELQQETDPEQEVSPEASPGEAEESATAAEETAEPESTPAEAVPEAASEEVSEPADADEPGDFDDKVDETVASDEPSESDGTDEQEADPDSEEESIELAATQPFSLADLKEVEEDVKDRPEELDEAAVSNREEEAEALAEVLPGDDEAERAEGEEHGAEPATATETAQSDYSFPDIVPLEEERSVFDDPSERKVTAETADENYSGVGFEDMLERAIADENASTSTGTAALILPEHPENRELSGQLGETGELFITGSIDLPKSLGETGGHSRLHETVESDSFDDLMLSDDYETGEHDSAPLSASQAVSARLNDKASIITPEVKKDRKLPLVLAICGGTLLVLVVAGAVYVVSSGLFS